MSKTVQILILSSLFSISLYAIDLNSTNQILEEATEATQELATQLEPIVEETLLENNNSIIIEETLSSPMVMEENSIIQTTTTPEMLEEEVIETPIETISLELNNTVETEINHEPSIENNLTEEKKEKPKEIEIVEKGDPRQGKNIFKYVLKEDCNTTAYKFAEKYTQEEWLEILEENKVKETIIQSCPNVKSYYQDKWTDDLYQFFYEASNEDEIPEC